MTQLPRLPLRPYSGPSLSCPELRRARPDTRRDRCLRPQRRFRARPLGFPGIADLPIGSWVLFVGTAFQGGPPTKILGYSITVNHAIPNESTNPSSVVTIFRRALRESLLSLR